MTMLLIIMFKTIYTLIHSPPWRRRELVALRESALVDSGVLEKLGVKLL